MTAEVAIMNEHAVVFAADSATTVSMWIDGVRKNRYFRGANKLFQLSRAHPVGLMIHGAATLQGVPWEILIKDFRVYIDDRAFERLAEYPQQLFDFLAAHKQLFPEEERERTFVDNAVQAMLSAQRLVRDSERYENAKDEERDAVFAEGTAELLESLKRKDPTEPIAARDIDAAIIRYKDVVVAELKNVWVPIAPEFASVTELLAELAIRELMTNYSTYMANTGIVIGGYGTQDYYPSFELYDCFGFLADKFITVRSGRSRSVARGSFGVIEGFAQDNMIDTFRFGLGFDAYAHVHRATEQALTRVAEKTLQMYSPDTPVDDLKELISKELSAAQEDWYHKVREEHYAPLARVISSLPVSDLAALAKSLVELQSLKERVTRESESVGGPIDVAVISKHDGFVWMERKHYFRPELNPRFFSRIRSEKRQ